jgi:hypothetical protein
MKAKRAISVNDILNYNPKVMNFEGRWFDSFGTPEMSGCWLIWGNSGNGKTRFALQLCKYLTKFGRVAYDSLEEGLSFSMKMAVEETGMKGAARRFVLLDREPVINNTFISEKFIAQVKAFLTGLVRDDSTSGIIAKVVRMIEGKSRKKPKEITCLIDRLERHKSPDIIVIDSLQYSGLNKDTAKELTMQFPQKLFIFVSHAEGQNPAGRTAKAVRFDANLKLRVEGYKIPAPVSRFKVGKCKEFVIWDEAAVEYWGE